MRAEGSSRAAAICCQSSLSGISLRPEKWLKGSGLAGFLLDLWSPVPLSQCNLVQCLDKARLQVCLDHVQVIDLCAGLNTSLANVLRLTLCLRSLSPLGCDLVDRDNFRSK